MAISSLSELNSCLTEPLTLVNLRAIMLLLTKAHYADADNFGTFSEELACVATDPDDPAGKLSIVLDFIPSTKNPSPRPAIWVNLESCKFDKKVIDNLAAFSDDNSRTVYVKMQNVVFTLTHVHESVDIALMMAETTADFFTGMRPHLMGTLNISMFEVTEIGKPKLPERAPERYFEVDVVIQMMFSSTVTTNIESHRLKKFALDLQPE